MLRDAQEKRMERKKKEENNNMQRAAYEWPVECV